MRTETESVNPRSGSAAVRWRSGVIHAVLIVGALIMVFPLLWMVTASFKPADEIATNMGLLPHQPTLDNYRLGWTGLRAPFGSFFVNSLALCSLAVVGNVVSCSLAAFAFARLRFPFSRVLFAIMLLTIMLPFQATIVPQYILFLRFGWVGTGLPILAPKYLAVDTFFVFLLVQFIRTIPTTLDDAARIDGCGPFRIFAWIILPLLVPALASTAIFTFIWTWNDFFSQLLYMGNNITTYTVPIALRAFVDSTGQSSWGQMLAMSVLALVPICVVFLVFQRLLLEGISTTGLKG
jgi:pectin-derived oligosaccharide transport system permease protein